jgi:hypothetical protein
MTGEMTTCRVRWKRKEQVKWLKMWKIRITNIQDEDDQEHTEKGDWRSVQAMSCIIPKRLGECKLKAACKFSLKV